MRPRKEVRGIITIGDTIVIVSRTKTFINKEDKNLK